MKSTSGINNKCPSIRRYLLVNPVRYIYIAIVYIYIYILQLSHEPEKIFRWPQRDSNPWPSAMLVQCSNPLSYEVTQLRAGQFVGLMFSRERKCRMKEMLYEVRCFEIKWKYDPRTCWTILSNCLMKSFSGSWDNCLKLSSKCEDHIFIWLVIIIIISLYFWPRVDGYMSRVRVICRRSKEINL